MSVCFCMGPQNGEPFCPCQMRTVKQMDGRWVRIVDMGPVQKPFIGKKENNNDEQDERR